MGITFRDGHYVNYIRIGKRTIKEGEYAMVWNVNGSCKKYKGPKLVRLWFSTIRFCTNYIANEKQYLKVSHKDGRTEHIQGPCSLFLDHLLHRDITVKDGIQIGADECLVVYNDIGTDEDQRVGEDVVRRVEDVVMKVPPTEIKCGPCMFFPKVRQLVEMFPWLQKKNELGMREQRYSVNSKQFSLLIEQSYTLSLREQRSSVNIKCKTKDDHELRTNFSFVWKIELSSVEKLISATQDPLSDLSYALKMDVAKMVSSQLHDDFIKVQDPFQADSFANLYEKSSAIGVTISQIHFEGYEICSAVLEEKNTKAKTEAEERNRLKAAEEKEKLNDFQLEKKMARAEKQAQSDLEEVNQRLQILDREHSAKLDRDMKEHHQRLEKQREIISVKTDYLKQLKMNGVDLTTYLIAVVVGERRKMSIKKQDHHLHDEEEEEEDDYSDAGFLLQNSTMSKYDI